MGTIKPDRYGRDLIAFLLIALVYVLNAMDRIIFPVLLPEISRDYAFRVTTGGLLATIFTLGLGLGGFPSGFVLNFIKRRLAAGLGIIVYSTATVMTTFAGSVYDMAACRVLTGAGEALHNTAVFTIAGSYFSRRRTLAMGILNVAYGLGSFLGPRLGAALLLASGSWRYPFYVFGGLGLLGAAYMLFVAPKCLTEAVSALPDERDEDHLPERLINRNTMLIVLSAVTGALSGYGYLSLYPTFLVSTLHYSTRMAADAASLYGVGAMTGLACGLIADKMNQKYISLAALVVLCCAAFGIFGGVRSFFYQEALSFLVGSAYSGFLYVNNYSLMQKSVRINLIARASGLLVTCIYLPASIAGYLFATLELAVGWRMAAILQLCLPLLIAFSAMLLFDTTRTTMARAAVRRPT